MTHLELVPVPPVAQLAGVSQHYGKTVALNNITLDIPARCMVGLIGPDGVADWSGWRREVELIVVDFRCPRH